MKPEVGFKSLMANVVTRPALARRAGKGLGALVELPLQFMHELVEALLGQGIDRPRSKPARLFKSPFELYSLLLFHVGMTGEAPLRFSSS